MISKEKILNELIFDNFSSLQTTASQDATWNGISGCDKVLR